MTLTLEGISYGLRPSYEAVEAFEASTGKGLLQLVDDALMRRLTLPEVAQIATECMRAWGRANNNDAAKFNAQRVQELIYAEAGGLRDVMATLAGMLAMAATGQYTAQGELKPATTIPTTTGEVPAAG